MGCDIHLMAEKKVFQTSDKERKEGIWVNIDKWMVNQDPYRYGPDNEERQSKMVIERDDRFYAGRNYNLFTALAGVRSEHFANNPPIISEPKGIPDDASPEYIEEVKYWKGDGHSHSYLTLKDIKEFDWTTYGNTCDAFIIETVNKLEKCKSFYNTDEDIRIVFFFDN